MKVRQSVSFKFFIAILLFSFLTAILVSGTVTLARRGDIIQEIHGVMDNIQVTQSSSIASGMWDLNFTQVELQLRGIVQLPYVKYAAVRYRDYELKAGEANIPDTIEKTSDLFYGDPSQGEFVGTLVLKADLSLIGNTLWTQFVSSLQTKTVENFLVAIFLFLLFTRLINRPLEEITRYIEFLDVKNLGDALKLRRRATRSEDEFDVITNRLNAMRINLQQAYQAQQTAENQLKLKIQEIENKNAELERFTYTVSHDLKSPLITIKGFSGYIRKDLESGQSDRAIKDVDRILAAVEKMQGLLEGLLELSRIGRVVNPSQDFNMGSVALEASELLEGRTQAGQASLIIAKGEWPTLRADRLRTREIWQNLFENALKYRGTQENLIIEAGFELTPEGPVYFVKDNGSGIEERYLETIFGLFEKLDNHSEGSGLGLALIKRIVELHNGRIWAESAGPGKGACFKFVLPTHQ